MAKKIYRGELGRLAAPPNVLRVAVAGDIERAVLQQQVETLNALFKHYGLAPDDPLRFELLAMGLAFDHVPAFKIAWNDQLKRRGRPRTGSDYSVYAAVETLHREKPDLSITAVCIALAKRKGTEFSAPTGRSAEKHGKDLERRFYRYRQRMGATN